VLRRGDGVFPRCAVGDVQLARFCRQAVDLELVGNPRGTCGVQIGHHRRKAVIGKTTCGRTADLSGCTGHDRNIGHDVTSRDATRTTSVPVCTTSPLSLMSCTDNVTILVPGLLLLARASVTSYSAWMVSCG